MHGGGDAGDEAVADAPVVGAVEVDADRELGGSAVEHGADGPEGLGEDGGGAAVQETVGLGVALDGHGADDAVGGGLDDGHAHALAEVAGGEEGGQVDAECRVLVDDFLREEGAVCSPMGPAPFRCARSLLSALFLSDG